MIAYTPEIRAAVTPALLARGCVNIIGLEPLRDQAGPRWEKIRPGLYARLETMLRERLSSTDFFVRLNDTAYLVTTMSEDPEDAQVACLRLSFDLYTSYLGQLEISAIKLYRALEGPEETLLLNPIPKANLVALAAKAGITDGRRGSILANEAGPGAGQTSKRTGAPSAHELFDGPAPRYEPLWDARKEAVVGYTCLPQAVGPAEENWTLKQVARARTELENIRRGVATLEDQLALGERFFLKFNISFESLSLPSVRQEFTSFCRSLSANLRPYILFELTHTPHGVPQSRVADLAGILRPFAKAVMVRVPIINRSFEAYRETGIHGIGIHIPQAGVQFADLREGMARLSIGAKQLGMTTFLSGVHDMSALQLAREREVHFVSGRALAPITDAPKTMSRLRWTDLGPFRARQPGTASASPH